ncbi:GNAT family N-acetyltransferase [Candidatus Woesearchaeota archaeon]|nr:GNAT family N-acetyltransferase [Candidatus Woesearchaeota archaeon]
MVWVRESDLIDKCSMYLGMETNRILERRIKQYLLEKIAYAEKGSKFEKEIGILKYLFRTGFISQLITHAGLEALKRRGYDVLMLELGKEIAGYTAFQIHADNSLHIFSVEVEPEYQGQGLAKNMIEEVLNKAKMKKISRIRLGAGGHEATNKLYFHLAKRSTELNITAESGNWINILYEKE